MKALAGRRIVVTRPKGQAEGLAALIREAGGEPLLIPAIEIVPLADTAAFHAFADRLDSFDLAIFVSGNAVRCALALLGARRWPARLKVATVGQGSRRALEEHGFPGVIAPPGQSDSEGLLAMPELADVRGRRIAILRGDAGRELLGEVLRKRGALVEQVACYQRVRPPPGGLAEAWAQGIDALTVSSSEGLANFMDMLGSDAVTKLVRVAIFVPHSRVAEDAARRGLVGAIVAGPGNAEMAAALVAYFSGAG